MAEARRAVCGQTIACFYFLQPTANRGNKGNVLGLLRPSRLRSSLLASLHFALSFLSCKFLFQPAAQTTNSC